MDATQIAAWRSELDRDRAQARDWAAKHSAQELADFQLFLLTDPEYCRGLGDDVIDSMQRLANIGLKQAIIDMHEA